MTTVSPVCPRSKHGYSRSDSSLRDAIGRLDVGMWERRRYSAKGRTRTGGVGRCMSEGRWGKVGNETARKDMIENETNTEER